MRLLILSLFALLLVGAMAPGAHACPDGYVPCGRGVCCPG
jgi:hypothetical protein